MYRRYELLQDIARVVGDDDEEEGEEAPQDGGGEEPTAQPKDPAGE